MAASGISAPADAGGGARPHTERYPIPPIQGDVAARFLPVAGLTIVLWVIAWPFLTLGFVNHYGSPVAEWIEGLYQRKDLALLESARKPEPRLVIIGGSGALFGVDAELIQQQLGVTTVNASTHAGLHAAYLLHRARALLRPGDSVLLCPEYELWWAGDVSDVEWDYVATYDKRFLWSSGAKAAVRMLYAVGGAAYYDSLVGWSKRLMGRYLYEQPAYNLATLDANGDLRGRIVPRRFEPPSAYAFPDLTEMRGCAAEFQDFARWARDNRIRVFYSWPNCCRPSSAQAAEQFRTPPEVRAAFDAWGFVLLNDPGDTWFPREWLVDTTYHPDAGCRRVRTEALIRRLRPYYGLPLVADAPSGIYLVAAGTHWLWAGNRFVDRPNVRARYLTLKPLDTPGAITLADLADLNSRGIPFWFDDPAIESMLPAATWDSREVDSSEASIADWLRLYDRHVFLLARAAGTSIVDLPLPESAAPGNVRVALRSGAPVVAVMGTGPWQKLNEVITDVRVAKLRTSTEKITRQNLPHLLISARAELSVQARSEISVNNGIFAACSDGQICVVVIDPAEGVVTNAATFAGGATKTLSSMKQLIRRKHPSDAAR